MTSSAWDPTSYDRRWTEMAAAGQDPHGEVAFVERLLQRLEPPDRSILDAGCGTGRVAVELARRQHRVQGTDVDADMLGHAREKAPEVEWHLGNLAEIRLSTRFGVVVMAGNVILFVDAADRPRVLRNVARHLQPGGVLVAGFQLARPDGRRVALADWDAWCADAGLELVERYSTWDEAPWTVADDYAVSVHRS